MGCGYIIIMITIIKKIVGGPSKGCDPLGFMVQDSQPVAITPHTMGALHLAKKRLNPLML
jgi:hypothetical protein